MKLISCPFCSESDFDLVGLKSHLLNHCDAFASVSQVFCVECGSEIQYSGGPYCNACEIRFTAAGYVGLREQ